VPLLRIGLLGGTFDPPHNGHLLLAQESVEQLSLDRLLLLVAKLPPHKLGEEISAPSLRLEMSRAAAKGNYRLEVSDLELGREGPSFTVDTLRHFRSIHPDAKLFFLLGADQLAEFHEWREPAEIANLATIVAVSRYGIAPTDVSPVELGNGRTLDFQTVPLTRVDISSSLIRDRVREGRSVRYMVPDDVRQIIETHRLYRPTS
jgi:nicotinate-nucleotide adenylyltransferase